MSKSSTAGPTSGATDTTGGADFVLTTEVRGELASCGHNMFAHVTSGSEVLEAASNEYRTSVSSVGKDMLTNPANTNLAIESLRQTADDALKTSDAKGNGNGNLRENFKRKGRDRSFRSNNFILPTTTKRKEPQYQQDGPMQRPSLSQPESHTGYSDHFASFADMLEASGSSQQALTGAHSSSSRPGGDTLGQPNMHTHRQDSLSNMLGMASHLPSSVGKHAQTLPPRPPSAGRPGLTGARPGSNMSLFGSDGNLMDILDGANAVQYGQMFNQSHAGTSAQVQPSLHDIDIMLSRPGGRGTREDSFNFGSMGGDMTDVMLGGVSASEYFTNPGFVPTMPRPSNNINGYPGTQHQNQQYNQPYNQHQQYNQQLNMQTQGGGSFAHRQRSGSGGQVPGYSGDGNDMFDFENIAQMVAIQTKQSHLAQQARQQLNQAQYQQSHRHFDINGGGVGASASASAGGYPYFSGVTAGHAGSSGPSVAQNNGIGSLNGDITTAAAVKTEHPVANVQPDELDEDANGCASSKIRVPLSGNRIKWSKFEDKQLRQAVEKYGKNNWHAVASEVEHRTNVQCRARWGRVLDEKLKKGFWSPEEDAVLISFVNEHTKANPDAKVPWPELKGVIPGRLVKQCRERYTKNLDERLKKGEWTEEEDALIMREHDRIGRKWATIGRLLTGRTEHSVKTRFVTLSKRRGWTKQEDASLMENLKNYGTNWEKITKRMANGRSATAIQKRYQSLFAISLKKKKKSR